MKKAIIILTLLLTFAWTTYSQSFYSNKRAQDHLYTFANFGYGYSTAGIGIDVGVGLATNKENLGMKIGSYFGIGIWPAFLWADSYDPSIEFVFGLRSLWGNKHHNIVIDFSYGTISLKHIDFFDQSSPVISVLGFTIGFGYQYTTKNNWTILLTGGYSDQHLWNLINPSIFGGFTASISIGYILY